MDWSNVLIAFFSGTAITSAFAFVANRRVKDAEAGSLVADAALKLLDPYIKRAERLEEKVKLLEESDLDKSRRIQSLEHDGKVTRTAMIALEKQLSEWAKGIQILINQIEERHNSKPDWRPGEG